jgi:alkaline phosphatase D
MRSSLRVMIIAFFGAIVASSNALAAIEAWGDGTPIARFDKRDDVSLTLMANWTDLPERHWAGPTIWTNRLQDWVVRGGSLICEPVNNAECRTAHLLTHQLSGKNEAFQLEVIIAMEKGSEEGGFAGFLIGAGEGHLDYRAASLVHDMPGKYGGILTVIETSEDGGLAFRDMSTPEDKRDYPYIPSQKTLTKESIRLYYHGMMLNLEGLPERDGFYRLRLSAWALHSGELLGAQEIFQVPASRLIGNVALVSHSDGKSVQHAFEGFKLGGGKFQMDESHSFGPIAGALYSISGSTLKLGAQFVHLGEAVDKDRQRLTAQLEVRSKKNPEKWILVDGPKAVSVPDYHILFRDDSWDSSAEHEARIIFQDARDEAFTYGMTIKRDPVDKPVVSLAGFTGMGAMGRTVAQAGPDAEEGDVIVGRWTPANVWMPYAQAVQAVNKQNVDILFFTGDQIYEGKPTPVDGSRMPVEDYLYKWLIWHWSFQELTRHIPAICQPDDHDVYHGNIWGWGGKLDLTNNVNDGGYRCSPYFVNMVHRTQTSHNPDAYDPIPLESGITNYYCGFTFGGIGFAVLEDRKFKTPPNIVDPDEQVMLGEHQEEFLRKWGEDWTGQKFKAVVSQTGYAAMHVNFEGKMSKDPDSGGFPKVRRDDALRLFRRCSALVLCGDQHLSTMTRLGIDKPSDAVYQFCVPALANIFWRWFYPNEPGADRKPGEPEYLGEFVDAWGNFLRMIAVANPERHELLGQKLRQRYVITEEEAKSGKGDNLRTCLGDGYGVVRFNKNDHTITVECWPHDVDPEMGGKQFAGWPIILSLEELDGRKPEAWLPDLNIECYNDPVVQIIEQESGEIIKITRTKDGFYRPGVFDSGLTGWYEIRDLKPDTQPGKISIKVKL